MRRVSVVALLFFLVVAGSFVVGGLSPGVALAQDKPAATPVDIFITPVFWLPRQNDYHAYGARNEIVRETPQGGLQLGLRYGNFAIGVSGLWMSQTNRLTDNTPGNQFTSTFDFDRYDLDLSANYSFRDVIKDRLSLSAGISYFTTHIYSDDICEGCVNEQARFTDHGDFWGLGPNLGATIRLADRWYLQPNAAAVWGERIDHSTGNVRGGKNASAFLIRSDAVVRFLLSDTVSLFAGYKTQLASSPGIHDQFWHGPVFGLTVRYNIR